MMPAFKFAGTVNILLISAKSIAVLSFYDERSMRPNRGGSGGLYRSGAAILAQKEGSWTAALTGRYLSM